MVNPLDPLSHAVPIVDAQGRPLSQFIRQWQSQRGVNNTIQSITTPEQVSAILDLLGSVPEGMLVRGASSWEPLPVGANGNVLTVVSGKPKWAASPGISALLDSISSAEGSVLYRGAAGWSALAPGTPGQVLITQGAGFDPKWGAASAGGAPYQALPQFSSFNTQTGDNFCTTGNIYQALQPLTISACYFEGQAPATATFTAIAGALNNVTSAPVTTSVIIGPTTATGPSGSRRIIRLPLATPLVLAAGAGFFLGVMRNDGTTTTPSCADIPGGTYPINAGALCLFTYRETLLTIPVGHTMNTVSGFAPHYYVGYDYQ